jgi:hypothetical protein
VTVTLLLAGCVSVPVIATVAVFPNEPAAVGVAENVMVDCCPTPRSPMSQWTLLAAASAAHVPLSMVSVLPSVIAAGSGSSKVTPAAGSGPLFLTWNV